jgi:hypothetical protein
MTVCVPPRTPYQGLVRIFDYNWPFYLRTAAGSIAAIILAMNASPRLRTLIMFAAGGAVFWACLSLLVTHYIYDRSGLYRMAWLPECLSRRPTRWITIHAGLDECSSTIESLFPGSEGHTVDIYDPRKMTEPSIKRARRAAGVLPVSSDPQRLPAPDDNFDVVFLIFAAHELRHHEDRVCLLREVARMLCVGGELVLVEHLRDWANFLAFGPGFLHFFSKSAWETAANSAGLSKRLHTTVTPFVHVFVFQKY